VPIEALFANDMFHFEANIVLILYYYRHPFFPIFMSMYCTYRPRNIFGDGMRGNAIPGVLSQDASRNGVPEPILPGIDIIAPSPLRPNFGSLCVPEPIFFRKIALYKPLTVKTLNKL
jgi:hypothetical protein